LELVEYVGVNMGFIHTLSWVQPNSNGWYGLMKELSKSG
jgi:hypothetical protein